MWVERWMQCRAGVSENNVWSGLQSSCLWNRGWLRSESKYALEVVLLVLCRVRVVQHPLVQFSSHSLVILTLFYIRLSWIFPFHHEFLPQGEFKIKKKSSSKNCWAASKQEMVRNVGFAVLETKQSPRRAVWKPQCPPALLGKKGSKLCSRVAVVPGACLLLFPNLGLFLGLWMQWSSHTSLLDTGGHFGMLSSGGLLCSPLEMHGALCTNRDKAVVVAQPRCWWQRLVSA